MLRQTYQIIIKDLAETGINKELGLQMAVKAINNTAEPDELIFTLLVFEAYSRMHELNPSTSNIIQRIEAVKRTMKKMRKIIAERQVNNVLNIKNGPMINHFHDLFLNSKMFV